MDPSPVLYEVVDRIAILTLDNPQKRNVLSRATLQALKEHLDRAGSDPAVRAIILRANGPVFSAGHDLRELAAADEPTLKVIFDLCTSVMETIRKLPRPVIARVQGLATAAGCQLAATCDLVVASENAGFATPGVKIGLFCSTPAVALSRVVGPKKAMEMLLTGSPITAVEAERIGLVNRVVPADRLEEATRELARQVIAASGSTLELGKRTFWEQWPLDRPEAYEVAGRAMVANAQAPAAREGFNAFLESRPPKWPD